MLSSKNIYSLGLTVMIACKIIKRSNIEVESGDVTKLLHSLKNAFTRCSLAIITYSSWKERERPLSPLTSFVEVETDLQSLILELESQC